MAGSLYEVSVQVLLGGLAAYLLLGAVFAIPFFWRGIIQVDAAAHGTKAGFRLMIAPGVLVFWPLLLRRWQRGVTEPPNRKDSHR
jgi:hypothetical protein